MNRQFSILIVEDDPDISEMLEFTMEREGFATQVADSAVMALRYVKTRVPDLVLLDIMLPGTDGIEILKRLKSTKETMNVPVIMVSAKTDELDQVLGLELGADDYVSKPFSPRVLLARVKRLLRRSDDNAQSDVLRVGDLTINPKGHAVTYEGRVLDLTRAEFSLLTVLAERPGWVFSREQLLKVTSQSAEVTARAVDVQIVGLRRKLGQAGKLIKTVRGAGYKIDAGEESFQTIW